MNNYWESIASAEMSDVEKFYEKVAEQMPNDCKLMELGIANGRSLLHLAALLEAKGKTYRLIGVDNCVYGGQDQRNEIIHNIINSGLKIEFWEMSSLDASCKLPDNYLDFVFIDSSHEYSPTKAELRLFLHKVKDGGIIGGHDYITCEAVKQAVDELVPENLLKVDKTRMGYGVFHFIKEHKMNLKC